MDVNGDFSKRVMLHGDSIEWETSPMPGVDRRRLDRIDTENERVTTIVRYAPESQFSSHVHTGGEEFIVMEGVFEDDYGPGRPVHMYATRRNRDILPGHGPGVLFSLNCGSFKPMTAALFIPISTKSEPLPTAPGPVSRFLLCTRTSTKKCGSNTGPRRLRSKWMLPAARKFSYSKAVLLKTGTICAGIPGCACRSIR